MMGNGEDDIYSIDVSPLPSGDGTLETISTPPKHIYGVKVTLIYYLIFISFIFIVLLGGIGEMVFGKGKRN